MSINTRCLVDFSEVVKPHMMQQILLQVEAYMIVPRGTTAQRNALRDGQLIVQHL